MGAQQSTSQAGSPEEAQARAAAAAETAAPAAAPAAAATPPAAAQPEKAASAPAPAAPAPEPAAQAAPKAAAAKEESPKKEKKEAAGSPKEKKQPLPPGEVKQTTSAAADSAGGKAAKGKGKGKSSGKQKGEQRREQPQAPKEPAVPAGAKLCVKNLPDDATDASVKGLFEPHGTVTSIDVKIRGDGKCRGFGFVSFATAEEATKAMEATSGTKLGEKELFVVVAIAKDKLPDTEVKGKSKGKGQKGEKGAPEKGRGKGKVAAKGKSAPPAAVQAAPASPSAAMYNPYYAQQVAAMYSQNPGYMYGAYSQYAQQYQAAAYYQYAAAAAAAASPAAAAAQAAAYSTPAAAYGASPSFGVPSSSGGPGMYDGTLKSLSEKNGYGFIVCEGTFSQYKRDVYVGQGDLPEGAKVGDLLRFEVSLNNKNHPKAAKVSILSSA